MKQLYLLPITLTLLLTACTVISPGLQTYDLPQQGRFTTEQGISVDVVPLTQQTIPQSAAVLSTRHYATLFNNKQFIYKLNTGDTLAVQLWAYPELNMSNANSALQNIGYTVDSQGNIFLPLLGKVHVSGLSVPELTAKLRAGYARYLKTPDVVVKVLSYEAKRYFVNGQVNKSGEYPLKDQPISLYTALSMAGGINASGDNTSIQLIRHGQTYQLNPVALERAGYSLHQLLIQPNDTIFVDNIQNNKLYVLGESNKSQALTLRDQGMTLSDVIGETSGINPYSASAARIYVMRTDPQDKSSKIYHVDLSNIGNFALANQFQMQKNDIVYIDATGLTRWQRVINQIVPFSSAIYSFQQLGNN